MTTKAPKIGKIKLTPKQQQVVAEGVETEFFKVISNIIRPERQVQLGLMALNMVPTVENLHEQRGRTNEWDQVISILRKIADEYNKTNGDADTEGVDPT